MTFFFDNDISPRVPRALSVLDETHNYVALRDHFDVSTPDTQWIPSIGRDGWILISKDYSQRRRKEEHSSLKSNNVKALYIRTSENQDLFSDTAKILKNWRKIIEWANAARPGDLARLTSKETIEKL